MGLIESEKKGGNVLVSSVVKNKKIRSRFPIFLFSTVGELISNATAGRRVKKRRFACFRSDLLSDSINVG